jgi:hypothetical protein
MGLQARRRETTAAAPAPLRAARKGMTNGELDAAIYAACETMDADCTARTTLQRLYEITGDATDEGAIVKLDGPSPVTLSQFDDALADLTDRRLQAGTLGVLRRVRELIVSAEARAAEADEQPVTRAEFEALANAHALALSIISNIFHEPNAGPLGSRLEIAAKSVEFESDWEGIQALLRRIEKASKADGVRQRRLVASRGVGGRFF